MQDDRIFYDVCTSHLIKRCEIWAKSKGCKQFASDCEVNNLSSINLHKKYGFNESAKLVHFIKNIDVR